MQPGSAGGPPQTSLSKPLISASPWVVLAVLSLGFFMTLVDTTIVNVAIPSIGTSLNAGLDQILWVLNAYILVYAVLLITAGRLGGMYGPKKLFIAGLVIFTLSSIACGASQNAAELIAFRVIQGAGAALLSPQTMSMITVIFPPEKRGAAFGFWGLVAGLATVTGPTLGGVLTTYQSWRAIFFVNVPVGVAAVALAFLVMPELTVHREHHLDVKGVVLVTVALTAGVFGLIEGQKYAWGRIWDGAGFDLGPLHLGLVSIPSLLLLCLLLLAAFVWVEMREAEPLLPLSLLTDRNYTLGATSSAVVSFCLVAVLLVLTLFLQSVLGLSALDAGIALTPFAVVGMVVGPLSGRLIGRFPGKYLVAAGLAIFGIGVALVIWFASLNATGWTFVFPLVLVGLGNGLTASPVATLMMENISPAASGAASGFSNALRQLGAVVSSSVVGAVLETRLASELNTQAQFYAKQLPSSFRAQFIKGFSQASSGSLTMGGASGSAKVAAHVPPATAHTIEHLSRLVFDQAFLNALRSSLVLPIVVAVAGVGVALLMRRSRLSEVAAAPAFGGRPVGAPSMGTPAGVPAGAREQPLGGPAASVSPAPGQPGYGRPTPQMAVAAVAAAPSMGADTIVLPVFAPSHVAAQGTPLRPPSLSLLSEDDRSMHVIKQTYSIGRLGDNDLVLEDPKVSRNHARIVLEGGEAVIQDLGSVNGTYVNDERVQGSRPIHDGDTLTVGDTPLIFHNDLEAARPRLVEVGNTSRVEPVQKRVLSIGRSPGNDIVIRGDRASRRHAEISIDSGQVLLRDLQSLNGTMVNGDLVMGERPLHDGDVVAIGDSAFVYHDDRVAASRAQPAGSDSSGWR